MKQAKSESKPAQKEKLVQEDKKQALKLKKPEAKKLEEKAKEKIEEKKEEKTPVSDTREPDFSEFVPELRKEERKPRIELTPSPSREVRSELESFVSSAPVTRERRQDRKSNYDMGSQALYGNPNEVDTKYSSPREDSRAIDDVGRLREFIQRKPDITTDQPLRTERQYRDLGNMPRNLRNEMNPGNAMQESFKSSYELEKWQSPENPFLGKSEGLKKYNTRKR